MKKIGLFVVAFLLMWSTALRISAKDGNVIYDGNAQKFIFAPGSDYSPTDLFPEFKDVMPGDRITQDIVVKNTASKDVDVKIYIRALGAHEDSVDFLSQLRLVVEKQDQQGSVSLFDGAASEQAQLTDWVCLGTFPSGSEVELAVTLEVPVELDNAYSSQIGKLDWEFMVEEISKEEPQQPGAPEEEEDTQNPESEKGDGQTPTGDALHQEFWLGMLMCSACMLIGVLWYTVSSGQKKRI